MHRDFISTNTKHLNSTYLYLHYLDFTISCHVLFFETKQCHGFRMFSRTHLVHSVWLGWLGWACSHYFVLTIFLQYTNGRHFVCFQTNAEHFVCFRRTYRGHFVWLGWVRRPWAADVSRAFTILIYYTLAFQRCTRKLLPMPVRAAGCRRKRRGSAAHLWCVLALGEKVGMVSVILPINLLRCLRICRRPPRFAEIHHKMRPLLFASALLKKRDPSRRLARSTEIHGQTSAEGF